jgi:hypothetical protein
MDRGTKSYDGVCEKYPPRLHPSSFPECDGNEGCSKHQDFPKWQKWKRIKEMDKDGSRMNSKPKTDQQG